MNDSDDEDVDIGLIKKEEVMEGTTLVTIIDDYNYDEETNPKDKQENVELFYEINNDL